MSRLFIWGSLSSIFFLTACDSSLSDLNEQQQYRFASALRNISKVGTAVKDTGDRFGGMAPLSTTGGQRDQDVEELVGKMQKAVTAGNCKVPASLPMDLMVPSPDLKMARPPSLKNVDFKIEGDRCPIQVSLQITGSGETLKGGEVTYQLHYEATDAEVRDIVDLDKADMTGKLSFSMKEGSGTPESEFMGATVFPFTMDATWTMEGTLHSATEGTLKTALKMNWNVTAKSMQESSGTSEFLVALGFGDFAGELRANHRTSDKGGESEYWLNARKLTYDQFLTIVPVKN